MKQTQIISVLNNKGGVLKTTTLINLSIILAKKANKVLVIDDDGQANTTASYNIFNDKYKDLLPEQKNILKEFITSVSSGTKLRKLCNEELEKISKEVQKLSGKVKDEVVKIKLGEVSKSIKPISVKEKITDTHLVNIMQYYDLLNELRTL